MPQSSRSQTVLLVSIMAAAIVIVGCAAVAAAYFMGYLGKDEGVTSTPASMPTPGQQVAGTAPDVALLPGETLVTTPPPKSAIPAPAPAPAPAKPLPAPVPAKSAAPRTETTGARIVPPAPRDYCVNCGVVTSIAARGESWDVVVRFEDGSSQTLRYPEQPRFRLNEHVHLEDGRLVKD